MQHWTLVINGKHEIDYHDNNKHRTWITCVWTMWHPMKKNCKGHIIMPTIMSQSQISKHTPTSMSHYHFNTTRFLDVFISCINCNGNVDFSCNFEPKSWMENMKLIVVITINTELELHVFEPCDIQWKTMPTSMRHFQIS